MNKLHVRTELNALPETVLKRLKKPAGQVLNHLYDRWDFVSNFGVADKLRGEGDLVENPPLEPKPSVSCSACSSLCLQDDSVSLSENFLSINCQLIARNSVMPGLTTGHRKLRSFGSHQFSRIAFLSRSITGATQKSGLLDGGNCRSSFSGELFGHGLATVFQPRPQDSCCLQCLQFKSDPTRNCMTGQVPVDICEINLEEHHCSVAMNPS